MPWPCNIRQLRNIAEQLSVFSDTDVIDVSDFKVSPEYSRAAPVAPVSGQSDAVLRERILSALSSTGGSHAAAAKLLNISTVTLWRWIKRVREHDPDFLKD